MVLNFHSRLALILKIASVSEIAWASSASRFVVVNPNCEMRSRPSKSRKWFKDSYRFPVGHEVIGKPSDSNKGLLVFQSSLQPRKIFAAMKSCMFSSSKVAASAPSKESESETPAPEAPRGNSSGPRTVFQIQIDAMSWQEGMYVKLLSDNSKTKLRVTNVGFCSGFAKLKVREKTESGCGACFLYAKAQMGNAAEVEITDAPYTARNVDVLGLKVFPTIIWRPVSKGVTIGATLPIVVRYGLYPLPADQVENFAIGPKLSLLVGFELETKLEWGRFYFSQKAGFLNFPNSLSWGLGLGYMVPLGN